MLQVGLSSVAVLRSGVRPFSFVTLTGRHGQTPRRERQTRYLSTAVWETFKTKIFVSCCLETFKTKYFSTTFGKTFKTKINVRCILEYFEKKDISLTKSISKLKPSKKIQWTDLEDDQRRLKVQATLKQIGDER